MSRSRMKNLSSTRCPETLNHQCKPNKMQGEKIEHQGDALLPRKSHWKMKTRIENGQSRAKKKKESEKKVDSIRNITDHCAYVCTETGRQNCCGRVQSSIELPEQLTISCNLHGRLRKRNVNWREPRKQEWSCCRRQG